MLRRRTLASGSYVEFMNANALLCVFYIWLPCAVPSVVKWASCRAAASVPLVFIYVACVCRQGRTPTWPNVLNVVSRSFLSSRCVLALCHFTYTLTAALGAVKMYELALVWSGFIIVLFVRLCIKSVSPHCVSRLCNCGYSHNIAGVCSCSVLSSHMVSSLCCGPSWDK